jgi:hypothetical protein
MVEGGSASMLTFVRLDKNLGMQTRTEQGSYFVEIVILDLFIEYKYYRFQNCNNKTFF